jgi:CBS domain-containing protein
MGGDMLVSQVLKEKGDIVFTISPDESLADAAALLHERQVGSAVVVAGDGSVAGIISERDLVRQLAQEGAAALTRPVSAAMTREVIFARPDETVDDLLARMTDRRVRHLPVTSDDGRLLGLVSIGDLVKRKIAETEAEAAELKAYIAA